MSTPAIPPRFRVVLGLLAFPLLCAAGDDEKKLDFTAFAAAYTDEHSLDTSDLTFEELISGDAFVRAEIGGFDLRMPTESLADSTMVERFQETALTLIDLQRTWFAWREPETTTRSIEKSWAQLEKWVASWKASKLKSCSGCEPSLYEQLEAKDKVVEAQADLREYTRPPKETIEAVGDLNVTVVAPTRELFLRICAMGGLLDPEKKSSLWTDKLINQTAAWYAWIQILALEDASYPLDYDNPTAGKPKTEYEKKGLMQYVADRGAVHMLRKEYYRHGTAFFEQTLTTNLVIAVSGTNGLYTQGEWKAEWYRAGASTAPYERFVPGGNPAGGTLPPRQAIPGPMNMTMTIGGAELSEYRTNLGEEFFLEVLQEGQDEGYKLASKDHDNPRRKERVAHFELVSTETHESTTMTAPFLGLPAEGKELPPDEYLDTYEDFFRAYRSCFFEWLRRNGSDDEEESAQLFGQLVAKHSVREKGTPLDAVIEEVYGVPLSSADPDVDSLEKRFLEWLPKGKF